MVFEEIRLLKQSEKSTVHLLREKGGEQMFIRKKLAGRHPIYQIIPHRKNSSIFTAKEEPWKTLSKRAKMVLILQQ